MLTNQTITSNSLESTQQWAISLASNLPPSCTIGLSGDLGAGKTTLIQGILKQIGYKGLVTSPSYTLVNEYDTSPAVIHIDLYRLDVNADWEEIGLDYYLNQEKICLIEWPECLPDYIKLDFTIQIEKMTENFRKFKLLKV